MKSMGGGARTVLITGLELLWVGAELASRLFCLAHVWSCLLSCRAELESLSTDNQFAVSKSTSGNAIEASRKAV